MTITELITRLQKLPGDALVYSEGCDCTDLAADVELDENPQELFDGEQFYVVPVYGVTITRSADRRYALEQEIIRATGAPLKVYKVKE